jgi:hypothetical protein
MTRVVSLVKSFLLGISAEVCLAGDPSAMILPAPASPPASYSVERVSMSGGSELVTIFRNTPNGSARAPLLSVLRDTLGDTNPDNDRLRYVWLLNCVRPGWWQHAAAAIPFFYSRAGSRKQDGAGPAQIADLSEKHPRVITDVSQLALQLATLDPAGLAFRAPTRAYWTNRSIQQQACFEQALAIITAIEEQPETARVFSRSELERLRARLSLGQRQFGGLAPESQFSETSANDLQHVEEARGRNWEIVRQAAETNGLWFDPLSLGSREPNYALVWIRRRDLSGGGNHFFEGQFLRISDPWSDPQLQNWKGYSHPDSSGDEMIPLALYDLEDTRAPLLLVDFRDNLKPKRHEIFNRGVTDLMKSIVALSYVRDWYYFTPRKAHDLYTGRRGAPMDPLERVRGYAKLKLNLGLDQSLDPPLRQELERQLGHLAMNPLEGDMQAEALIAQDHYAALLRSAQDPAGLPARVERDRSKELRPILHSGGARFLSRLGTVLSAGLYHHREPMNQNTLALLDVQRRTEYHEKFLEKAAAGSRIEVEFDADRVRQSVEFLADKPTPHRQALFGQVLTKTQDQDLRRICMDSLRQGHEKVSPEVSPASWKVESVAGFELALH